VLISLVTSFSRFILKKQIETWRLKTPPLNFCFIKLIQKIKVVGKRRLKIWRLRHRTPLYLLKMPTFVTKKMKFPTMRFHNMRHSAAAPNAHHTLKKLEWENKQLHIMW